MSEKKVDSYKAGKNNRSRTAKKGKTDRQSRDSCVGNDLCCHGCMDIPPMQK